MGDRKKNLKSICIEPFEQRLLFGAGDLDPTFNGHGWANINVGAAGISKIVAQSDSKIVVAGTIGVGSAADFFLVRVNADGSPDTTFGYHGTIQTDFGGADTLADITIDAQARIIAVGSGGPNADFAVARYTTSGSLDTSFSGDGKELIPFGGTDTPLSVSALASGKIEIVGTSTTPIAAARLNADGSFDGSFAGDGTASLAFPPADEGGFSMDNVFSAEVSSDGNGFISGTADNGDVHRVAGVDLTTAGTLQNFSEGGSDDEEPGPSAGDPVTDASISSNFDTSYGLHFDRPDVTTPAGVDTSHDTQAIFSLGNSRFVIVASPYDEWRNPGTILLCVSVASPEAENSTLFSSFGINGITRTQFTSNPDAYVDTAALDPQGRILVLSSGSAGYTLARYQTTGTPNPSPVTVTHTGMLSITGSSVADDISVSDTEVDISGIAYPFDASKIKRITIDAGGGNDTVAINTKRAAAVLGGAGDDLVIGGSLNDVLDGGNGNDTLEGALGNDTLSGDAGNDVLNGNTGNDNIHGGDGNDTIVGAKGHDRLYGDAGDDQLIARDHLRDTLYGGDGNDQASVDQSKKIKDLFGEIETLLI